MTTLETDFPELVEFKKGGSWSRVFQTLYYITVLRYSTLEMLQGLTGNLQVATRPKLEKLAAKGFIRRTGDVYTSTQNALNALVKRGYNPALLNSPAEGNGAEIYTQEAIAKLLEYPRCLKIRIDKTLDYPVFLYPHFSYLIPDGLWIEVNEAGQYRLSFIEVEKKKADWENYLLDKKEKYDRLSDIAYRYWETVRPHLGIGPVSFDNFRFQVVCIGDIKFDWRGWSFVDA